jgi:hypothetical protein
MLPKACFGDRASAHRTSSLRFFAARADLNGSDLRTGAKSVARRSRGAACGGSCVAVCLCGHVPLSARQALVAWPPHAPVHAAAAPMGFANPSQCCSGRPSSARLRAAAPHVSLPGTSASAIFCRGTEPLDIGRSPTHGHKRRGRSWMFRGRLLGLALVNQPFPRRTRRSVSRAQAATALGFGSSFRLADLPADWSHNHGSVPVPVRRQHARERSRFSTRAIGRWRPLPVTFRS